MVAENKDIVDLQLEGIFQKIGGVEMESSDGTQTELLPSYYSNYLNEIAENVNVICGVSGAILGIGSGFILTGGVNTHNWEEFVVGVGIKITAMGIGAIYGVTIGFGVGFIVSDITLDLIQKLRIKK